VDWMFPEHTILAGLLLLVAVVTVLALKEWVDMQLERRGWSFADVVPQYGRRWSDGDSSQFYDVEDEGGFA
jgi:hypothetical protein